ncbi:MAG TPA: hypothetical protein VJ781_10030 [Pyrinomonadaceae bacterium]|jgi:hypothetical protein|nr:hypothetical protein [Pyrinomonadaceae bacterium]
MEQVARQKNEIGKMLERLGNALITGDLKGISSCYAFPALFGSDENSRMIANAAELELLFAQARNWFISKGIRATRAELQSFEQVSETVAAVDVRWPGFDEARNEIHTETSHYIIQTLAGKASIRVALTRGR